MLRRFPVFPVFGNGDFPSQLKYAEDLAAQAVAAGAETGNSVADAAGPEMFSFEELLHFMAMSVGARFRLVQTPLSLGFAITRLVGLLPRDLVLAPDDVDGLTAGLMTSYFPPTGTTKLGE